MSTLGTTTGSDSATLDDGKRADLSGPGIGTYDEVAYVLPTDYRPRLGLRETQEEIFAVKRLIEDRLCAELGLTMVQVPLIVASDTGVNDMLDRDGSRTPICFHISNDRGPSSDRGRGRPSGDEVEAAGADPVRHGPRRGSLHRHARGPKGLLPRS